MKIKLIIIILMAILIGGCAANEADLSDPLNTGREFIRASLRSDYVKAERYMLKDSINKQYLDRWRDFSSSLSKEDREDYANASIIVDSTRMPDDSTEFIYYKNSFKKEPTRLKVVSDQGQWKVDFKYTFTD